MALNYYAVQVKTRSEEHIIKLLMLSISGAKATLIYPRRMLKIRRMGKITDVLSPIFPGYIFIACDKIDADLYWIFKKTDGFYRFLKSNQAIEPLGGYDRQLLLHFIQSGQEVRSSKVTFDANDRIIILEGPLKGLEAFIIKVDKRKGRAKLKLPMCGSDFTFDLGFDCIERIKKGDTGNEERGTEN